MRTAVPERILKIADDIAANGQANVTRLTVLKKWFERPDRLMAFAVWVAARATSRKGKTGGEAAQLFKEASRLLRGLDKIRPRLNPKAAARLYDRLREFQNQYERQRWGPVRIIKNWQLLVIEKALAVYLRHADSPEAGYDLASIYFRHHDSRRFELLSGPSRAKLDEFVRFMFTLEALEDER